MPELPEVEVTRRGIAAPLHGAQVLGARTGKALRWPLGVDPRALVGLRVGAVARRGKYLWLPLEAPPVSGEPADGCAVEPTGPAAGPDVAAARPPSAAAARAVGPSHAGDSGVPQALGATDAPDPPDPPQAPLHAPSPAAGGLLVHLGMSGSLAMLAPPPGQAQLPPGPHDHFDLRTDRGTLRLTDPRRFGAVVWSASTAADPAARLLSTLGAEPFDPALTPAAFHAALRRRRVPVKTLLLGGSVVVGAGNIYACEALHEAGIDPRTRSDRISAPRAARLLQALRAVLSQALALGGSTLRDFTDVHGAAGAFQSQARVYGRAGQPCARCGGTVLRLAQAQRSTFFCRGCQRR